MSRPQILSTEELLRALTLRDLTDPARGPHAMQCLLDELCAALTATTAPVEVHRASPIVSIADNYDRLGYPPDGAARDARHTRYVCDTAILRTQTSALIPPLLSSLASAPPDDVFLACPGLVYRRDVIDRLHVGEPHQIDLWRITEKRMTESDLDDMIAAVVDVTLPGARWRTAPVIHPYTEHGRQIDVALSSPYDALQTRVQPAYKTGTPSLESDEWVEIGECGLVSRALIDASGLRGHTGLAMGLGLDRLVMLRKGIDDIRLLRASDPRIASQMLDLAPYKPVSTMPPVRRDLSLALDAPLDAETLGDRVRAVLGDRAEWLESVEVLSVTPASELPAAAVQRIGISPSQYNQLVRLTLRAVDRTLTHDACNELRDAVYAALHQGTAHQWARL